MRSVLALLIPLLTLCACGGAPSRPITPDGRGRVPANSPDMIERYRAATGVAGMPSKPDAMAQRLTVLEAELVALRRHVAMATAQPTAGTATLALDGAELVLRTDRVLLRLPQPFAQARCTLRPGLRALLLNIASQSEHIEIRGRTDATAGDPVNQRLAEQRAACAHRMLLRAGVPPARLHASALAAGDFIADNGSAAGRARNRRVDIELLVRSQIVEHAPATSINGSTP